MSCILLLRGWGPGLLGESYSNDSLLRCRPKKESNLCVFAATDSASCVLFLPGEICAFKIHGQEAPFEAEVLNRTSGEGVLRARGLIDCEQQKEYTFIIQAYDCGASPSGANWKKSHK